MLDIGKNVVYSGDIMTLMGVRRESVLGEEREYYVLRAVGSGDSSLTFIPCDNETLVSAMRPLITKREIDSILKTLSGEPGREWIEDNRMRTSLFKKTLESGERIDILRMIRDIRKYAESRAAEGKKSYLTDDNFLRRGEHRILSEFSVVLGITPDEAREYIKKGIKG